MSGAGSYCPVEKSISKINRILKEKGICCLLGTQWHKEEGFDVLVLFCKQKTNIFYKILGKNKCEKWTSRKLLEFHTLSFVRKTIDCNQIWFELFKGNGQRITFSLFNQKFL